MKPVLVLSLLVLGLAACTSEYIIGTRDGTLIAAHGKPRLDDDTGMYRYKDRKGRKGMVRKEDVVEILER